MPVSFGGHNLPPLVEIGLTDLSKSGGGAQAPPLATGLFYIIVLIAFVFTFQEKKCNGRRKKKIALFRFTEHQSLITPAVT